MKNSETRHGRGESELEPHQHYFLKFSSSENALDALSHIAGLHGSGGSSDRGLSPIMDFHMNPNNGNNEIMISVFIPNPTNATIEAWKQNLRNFFGNNYKEIPELVLDNSSPV